jgi:hypothetical protein
LWRDCIAIGKYCQATLEKNPEILTVCQMIPQGTNFLTDKIDNGRQIETNTEQKDENHAHYVK